MAVTIEDQVSLLLSRRMAEAKSRGMPSPDLEAAAVFESIALNLVLQPRTVLLIALLARNKLQQVVQAELEALQVLRADISDLGNASYTIQDTAVLNKIKTSLLQIQSLQKISSTSGAFQRFDNAVNEFLEGQLAKTVRQNGSSGLTRSSAEAGNELPPDFVLVKTLHESMLERLYSLAVGIENFLTAPVASLLGTTTVARARQDLDDIISLVEDGQSAAYSRDIAVRVLTSRAAIKTLGSPPDPFANTLQGVQGESEDVPVSAESVVGPFAVSSSATIIGTSSSILPCPDMDITGKEFIVSDVLTFPFPANSALLLTHDEFDDYTISLSNAVSVADAISRINGAGILVKAAQFGRTNRVVLYSNLPIMIRPNSVQFSTVGSSKGPISADLFADCLTSIFNTFTIERTPDDTIKITGAPGQTFNISSSVLGIYATFAPRTNHVLLDPGLSEAGDYVITPAGRSILTEVLEDGLLLEDSFPLFSGPVTVTSSLVTRYQELDSRISAFLDGWSKTPYVQDLGRLDALIAPLDGSAAPAQRNMAVNEIDRLEAELNKLFDILQDPDTILPTGAAAVETEILNGIIATLEERRFDLAEDMLLKCQIQEFFTLNADTASYGTNMLTAASKFAQSDMKTPNYALDEGSNVS